MALSHSNHRQRLTSLPVLVLVFLEPPTTFDFAAGVGAGLSELDLC
jgi:hypothetical protein